MPVTSTEIAEYAVSIPSAEEPNGLAATVSLFDSSGRTLAFLRFYVPEHPPDPNEFRSDLGFPLISYPVAALQAVVDILRNEKPVFFTWFDYRPTRCFGAVSTSREPAGEGEAAAP